MNLCTVAGRLGEFELEATTRKEMPVREYFAELIRSLLTVVALEFNGKEVVPDSFCFRNMPAEKISLIRESDT